ncbi:MULTISPECIES: septum site-determining protein MinC [unclassified Candidatus Frackibacter]|uniref:septum site-determining protein MinC n=1 Tax=unclassified Candidatus Frackibacter TaxID=2648818 RepID=UPI000882151F|nr:MULTISPECIES: septum site-determining protein MinC [unclassified Candidatus Frackibacter]SDC40570.1 septum site-determining protein MinC [Candidatus Frackibacter sp. WG11]SEM60247.1 septum site-determining protein MinC [Candidatus Frackibacter sp. WG12]SFL61764.1 septum site-determining protein MinC [Candidatus Frackibacter sp. WG13]
MQKDRILFKWEAGHLIITLDEDLRFDYLVEDLKEKVTKAKNFFINAKIKIEVGRRELSFEEKEVLIDTFASLPGLSVIEIIRDDMQSNLQDKAQNIEHEPETSTLFLHRTLRSGQSVEYDGNIVIIGDVNPGAEVVAKGDIVVMGVFRGVAHAGVDGSNEATIVAFRLQPTQLRIGNKICRAPDGEVKHPNNPEIASVKDDTILIEDLRN